MVDPKINFSSKQMTKVRTQESSKARVRMYAYSHPKKKIGRALILTELHTINHVCKWWVKKFCARPSRTICVNIFSWAQGHLAVR